MNVNDQMVEVAIRDLMDYGMTREQAEECVMRFTEAAEANPPTYTPRGAVVAAMAEGARQANELLKYTIQLAEKLSRTQKRTWSRASRKRQVEKAKRMCPQISEFERIVRQVHVAGYYLVEPRQMLLEVAGG